MSSFRQSSRQKGRSQRVVHRMDFPIPLRRTPRPGSFAEQASPEADPAQAGGGEAETKLAEAQAKLADLERFEEQLLARAEARLRASQPKEGADKRRVEQLERRLRKLSGELDERDKMLRQLLSKSQEDQGVASLTGITGLDEEDAQFEAKKEMMSSIFKANLDLRRRVES